MAIYSGFSHKKMVIFNSYVSLPEGIPKRPFLAGFKHIPSLGSLAQNQPTQDSDLGLNSSPPD